MMIGIFTGRNEVVAMVIFLHLSVIHSVHRGGVLSPRGVLSPGGCVWSGGWGVWSRGVSGLGGWGVWSRGVSGPGGVWKQTRAYGQRAAGTHPPGLVVV